MEKFEKTSSRKHIKTAAYHFWSWLPVCLWMLFIYTLSTRQRVEVSDEFVLNFIVFKTLHLIEYGFLYVLVHRGFVRAQGVGKRSSVGLWSFLVVVFYAITDELHQRFVPTREGTVRDVIIDATGAILVWYFLYNVLPKTPKKLKNLAKSLDII